VRFAIRKAHPAKNLHPAAPTEAVAPSAIAANTLVNFEQLSEIGAGAIVTGQVAAPLTIAMKSRRLMPGPSTSTAQNYIPRRRLAT
jgi:hypothetical protein